MIRKLRLNIMLGNSVRSQKYTKSTSSCGCESSIKVNVHLSDNIVPTKLSSRELKLCVQTLNRKRRAKNVTIKGKEQ